MVKLTSLLKIATEEAEKSNYKQRIGAVIFDKNRILSRGYNKVNRACHSVKAIYRRWPCSIHAEVDTILRAKKDLKGTTILIARINKKGDKYLLSKPCPNCMAYLVYVGIKRVIYTTSEFPYLDEFIIIKGEKR